MTSIRKDIRLDSRPGALRGLIEPMMAQGAEVMKATLEASAHV